MTALKNIKRPSKDLITALEHVGSATASGELKKMGISDPFIQGPTSFMKGRSVVGPALTLQCLPIREDVYVNDEYSDPEQQLHRQVLYCTQPGDVVVVDARGDMTSGVFGEMMLTFFQGQGGIGIVVDGCIRDYVFAQELEIGMWLRGVTPNFHTQTNIFPNAYNVPIACGGTLVNPGDIIIADDDGSVVVPIGLAEELAGVGGEHSDWEIFCRMKLASGGHLKDYYPRKNWSDETENEYTEWTKNRK